MLQCGISRETALELLDKHIENPNMKKHCLAAESVMKALARYFQEDPEIWGMAGLLHDIDVELTNADLAVHGREAEIILSRHHVDPKIVEAVKMHNDVSAGKKRTERFHHALAAGETITGLIIATALVYPDKKLASVKPTSIIKRMNEKSFAASVNRDIIRECECIGIPLPEFATIALDAMCAISDDLGL